MRVIDAFWEKRNLGKTTTEIIVDECDDAKFVEQAINEIDSEYIVIKVPAGKIDVMWKLEDLGFKYIETAIHVENDLKHLELDGILKRIDDGIKYEKMNDKEIQQMFCEIRKGIFNTDRVYLDPFFSEDIASNRYILWISDEIEKGTEIYKYIYNNQVVGFFSFKMIDEGIFYPFLAGIYKDYQSSPLGMVYLYKPLLEAKKRDAKCVSTYISTNNANAVRMHVRFGFTFKEMVNVYVRHK